MTVLLELSPRCTPPEYEHTMSGKLSFACLSEQQEAKTGRHPTMPLAAVHCLLQQAKVYWNQQFVVC